MIKYIISSGNSVVTSITNDNISVSKDSNESIRYDIIGDAMRNAIEVNKILNTNSYRVMSIEV